MNMNTPIHQYADQVAGLRAILAAKKYNARTEAERIKALNLHNAQRMWEAGGPELRQLVLMATRLNHTYTPNSHFTDLTEKHALEVFNAFRRMINFVDKFKTVAA